jgi:ribulose bisphosphate carboxylase small subunit
MSEYVIRRLCGQGYAQGLDFRLNGEFVQESWFSFGYLKTEETAKIEAISLGRQIRD